MRISEKTVELNFCAEVSSFLRPINRLMWFGLTQKQEAQMGFDACSRMNGRLLIFQFKASNHLLKNGRRKFHAQHGQMTKLKQLSLRYHRSVFYALPSFGNSSEFVAIPDLLSEVYLADLTGFPNPIPPSGRKSNYHNMYFWKDAAGTPLLKIYSNPFMAEKVFSAKSMFGDMQGDPTFEAGHEDRIISQTDRERSEKIIGRAKYSVNLNDAGIPAEIFSSDDALFKLLGKRRIGMCAMGIMPE